MAGRLPGSSLPAGGVAPGVFSGCRLILVFAGHLFHVWGFHRVHGGFLRIVNKLVFR